MKNQETQRYVKLGTTAAAVVAFGLVFFFMLYRADGLSRAMGVLTSILRPFLYGAIIAWLVTPMARTFAKRFGKPEGSGLANALALLIAVVIVIAIVLLIVPQVVNSVMTLAETLPDKVNATIQEIDQMAQEDPELMESWTTLKSEFDEVYQSFQSGGGLGGMMGQVKDVAFGALNTVTGALGLMKDLLIGVIIALYLLSKRSQLAAQATMIVRGAFKPEWADWIENETRFANRMFNGFFMGKLLDSAIIGAICFVGCLVMRFESPLLIAVIVGVTNIIPFFGPFIGAIPCVLLLLLENPMHALMFLVFVIVLQQIDGNIIGPKILGDSTGLSALWVMFGILLFGGFWGIIGMLVGVPLMAVIYDIVRQLTFKGVRKHGREDMIEQYNAKFHPQLPVKVNKAVEK